jgi:imidazolonepropionase-like amidohydrolase
VQAGSPLSAGTALGAGSWTARRWLGLPGLEPGALADLVAYREDPRKRPDILSQPAVVILNGAVAPG